MTGVHYFQLANIAVVLSVATEAVSVKNTPPINEIYEVVLRNKFENRDNKERLLLEMSDLQDTLQGNSHCSLGIQIKPL